MENKNLRRGKIVKNDCGVNIRRCCASCANKSILSDGCRICKLNNQKVKQRQYCKNWERVQILNQCLKGDGQVKTKRYLKYVMRIRLKEFDKIEHGKMLESECLTIAQIRTEYEQKFGSIFI